MWYSQYTFKYTTQIISFYLSILFKFLLLFIRNGEWMAFQEHLNTITINDWHTRRIKVYGHWIGYQKCVSISQLRKFFNRFGRMLQLTIDSTLWKIWISICESFMQIRLINRKMHVMLIVMNFDNRFNSNLFWNFTQNFHSYAIDVS